MQVSYNNIVMQLVHVREWSRAPVMSDDGTELLATRHTLDLELVINTQATSYNGSPPVSGSGSLPGVTDKSIRYALLQPQKQLIVQADDSASTVVLMSPATGSDIDVSNGPFPMGCNVRSITPATWRVSWRVRTDIIECGSLSNSTSPILSNRFSQTQVTGPDHRTSITYRGVTTFRADQLDNLARAADYYRDQCIPGCPNRFQRQSIAITVNSPGTVLSWEVRDVEQFQFIGATSDNRRFGVVSFEAVFSTSSSRDDKGVPMPWTVLQFDAKAIGDASSSRQQMLYWLAKLAVERCSIPAGIVNPSTNPMILGVQTREHIHEPAVSLTVQLQMPVSKVGAQGLGPLRTDFIGVDVFNTFSNDGQSPQFPNDNNTRGTANLQMFASALKASCTPPDPPPGQIDTSSSYQNDNMIGGPTSVSVGISSDPPSTSTQYSDDAATNGTYTEMTVSSRWTTDRGTLAMPIAGNYSGLSNSDGYSGSTDVAVVQVCNPMSIVEFEFEGERSFEPPVIPNPIIADGNLTLLSDDVWARGVGLAPDGQTPVFRIAGKYRYVATQSRNPTASITFAVHPWTDWIYGDYVFQQSGFVHGLIDGSAGSYQSLPPYTPGVAT